MLIAGSLNPELTEPADNQLCDTGYPGSQILNLLHGTG